MDPFASIVDNLRSFGQNFINGFANRHRNNSRQNPMEILKRLQRESFADVMKVRDRLDKLERVLISYKTIKGNPFQEYGTNVRGEVDVMGPLFLIDYLSQENVNAVKRAGIKTGIDARITFATKVREEDILKAEFISGQINHREFNNTLGNALSLARVSYKANLSDWCMMNAVPMGARCHDVSISNDSLSQEKGLTDYPSFGPPLLHQDLGCAFGLMLKSSHLAISLHEFVDNLPCSFGHIYSSFGEIVCQLPKSTKLSLYFLRKKPNSRKQSSPGLLTVPLGSWLLHNHESSVDSSLRTRTNVLGNVQTNSLAAMLESELDESTRVQGWLQVRDNPDQLQWSVRMSDLPEDEMGWGLGLGGSTKGFTNVDRFQVEAFLKFNLSKKLSLQPGVVYLMDGTNQIPALMCRSTWSI